MDEYKPSFEVKEEPSAPPASAVKKKQKTRFSDVFIKSDVNSVRDFVWKDILYPEVIKIIYSIGSKSLHMFLYGTPGEGVTDTTIPSPRIKSTPLSGSRGVNERTHYDESYAKPVRRKDGYYRFDEYIFSDKEDARECLDRLDEIIRSGGSISVINVLDEMGHVNDASSTDESWGWETVKGARIEYNGRGWYLAFPEPIYIPV